MASTSAEKAARVSVKRQQRNKSIRSEIKTEIIKAEKLIFAGDVEAAEAAVKEAVSTLDKAGEKKILHGNNAARRKARLLKKLNQLKAQPPVDEKEAKEEKQEEAD